MSEDRITRLEEELAHTSRTIDDLSAVVADQAQRLARAEKQLSALLQRAVEQEAEGQGGAVFGDEQPPHW